MKKILVLFAVIIFASFFYFFWLTPKYVVPIFTYHSIGYGEGGFFVSPENFFKQMDYIKKHGYEVLTLDQLVESIKEKKILKRNKVVITFDDGYKDNFEYAYPILKKFNFPATIFVISDFVGKSFNDQRDFFSWEDMTVMSKNKISFGSHTRTHFYLGIINDEKKAIEEIEGAKTEIEQKTGLPVGFFCYPGGGFNERAKELIKLAGYKGACVTNRGFARYNSDVYELKRIKITNADSGNFFSFWAKLSGYYNIFRKEKNPN